MAQIEKDMILKVDTSLTLDQVQKFFSKTPKEKIKYRPAKGGGQWSYVSGSYVTQVLNSLFGYNWSFEVITSMPRSPSGRLDWHCRCPGTPKS